MKKLILLLISLLMISCQTFYTHEKDYNKQQILIQSAKESVLKIEQDSYFETIDITFPSSWDYYSKELPSFNQIANNIEIIIKDILQENSREIIDPIFLYLSKIDIKEITNEELITMDSMSIRIKNELNLKATIYNILNKNFDIINEQYLKAEELSSILKTNLENLKTVNKYINVPSINSFSIIALSEDIYTSLLEELAKNEINLRKLNNE